jgi:hypothetical protein
MMMLVAGAGVPGLTRSLLCGADHIHAHTKGGQAKDYSLAMIPRRTKVCERILEEEGVLADVQLRELNMDLVPFDDDVISLEMDGAFREVALVRRRRRRVQPPPPLPPTPAQGPRGRVRFASSALVPMRG